MNLPFTLSTVGGIIGALVLFIVLKRVIGLVFRVILACVLVIAVIVGAWWWTRPGGSSENTNARPQRTRSRQ